MVPDLWLVGLGGVVGALLRYYTSELVARETFPVGTLTVNVVGSFVLGLVTVLDSGNAILLFVGTGACGSYTTFSSFSFDTVRLWEGDEQWYAVAFAAVNLVGSIAAIGAAWVLSTLLPV